MKTRFAAVAAVLAFLASTVIVLQYLGTFAVRVSLYGSYLQFNSGPIKRGDPEKSFYFVFKNMGPDDMRNVAWLAVISGIKLEPFGVRGIPLIVRGSDHADRDVTSPDMARLTFDDVLRKDVSICVTFSGGFPGAVQWVRLKGRMELGGVGQGASLVAVDQGSAAWPWGPGCLSRGQ